MGSKEDVLLRIYIGQNIRSIPYRKNEQIIYKGYGILESEIRESKEVKKLMSEGLVRGKYLPTEPVSARLLVTTEKGSEVASALLKRRLEEKKSELEAKFKDIPKKVLGFIIENSDSDSGLIYRVPEPLLTLEKRAEKRILSDSRMLILRDKLFRILSEYEFCVKTWYYLSHDILSGYVISPEVREFLMENFATPLSTEERKIMDIYSFLVSIMHYLHSNDIDLVRQQFYRLLKQYNLEENDIAAVVQATFKKGITSEYYGLLYDGKPFEIKDLSRFEKYLENEIIKPMMDNLLGKGEFKYTFKEYEFNAQLRPLSEVKEKLGLLSDDEIEDFYTRLRYFENELREFLKKKLGKGWLKRLKNELPEVVGKWEERKKDDEEKGKEPEKDLIKYADFGDYIEIIKKYKRGFTSNPIECGEIIAHLKDLVDFGRNPIAHARTITQKDIHVAGRAMDYLENWMERKSKGTS